MSKMLARNVSITYGDSPIAGATEASLSLTTVFSTSRTKHDTRDKKVPERVDWTVSSSSVVGEEGDYRTSFDVIRNAAKSGDKMDVIFAIGSLALYQGECIVSAYEENAPVDGRPSCKATFKGVGKLTRFA